VSLPLSFPSYSCGVCVEHAPPRGAFRLARRFLPPPPPSAYAQAVLVSQAGSAALLLFFSKGKVASFSEVTERADVFFSLFLFLPFPSLLRSRTERKNSLNVISFSFFSPHQLRRCSLLLVNYGLPLFSFPLLPSPPLLYELVRLVGMRFYLALSSRFLTSFFFFLSSFSPLFLHTTIG